MSGKGKNKVRVVERKLYEVGIFGPPYCTDLFLIMHEALSVA